MSGHRAWGARAAGGGAAAAGLSPPGPGRGRASPWRRAAPGAPGVLGSPARAQGVLPSLEDGGEVPARKVRPCACGGAGRRAAGRATVRSRWGLPALGGCCPCPRGFHDCARGGAAHRTSASLSAFPVRSARSVSHDHGLCWGLLVLTPKEAVPVEQSLPRPLPPPGNPPGAPLEPPTSQPFE